MRVRGWFWPARHLLVLFLAVTVLPAAALFWLSWRSLAQDRRLEAERIRASHEQAADLVVTALEQKLAAEEQRLESYTPEAGDDAVVVEFAGGHVGIRPKTVLPYYPAIAPVKDVPAQVFSPGEELEFRQQDYARAIAAFRELARSPDARIRAGAHLRIARNLRKAGQAEAALAEYSELAKYGSVPLDSALNGMPADLVARRARYALLEELKRQAESREEAESLARDLDSGRWQLEREAYIHYAAEIGHQRPQGGVALAEAVEWLWSTRNATPSGRRSVVMEGRAFTLLWRGERALAAGPRYTQQRWVEPLSPLLKGQGARLVLGDTLSGTGAFRAASVTGLPWNLRILNDGPEADLSRFAARQRFLLAAAGLLAALLCAGSYWIARAVRRELAVARLQSDFVAAVSHEFRTPLTLLRQTTEAFMDNRAGDERERRSYFAAQARATDRLRRLVESLLDFGRMEAGAKPYRLQPLDAARFTRGVVEEFQREAGGCRVEFSAPEEPVAVEADPDALTHALWNLLDNAVKYSPESRNVWVKVERRGGEVAIGVRDQGIGIPRAEHKAVFRKFVRGAAARSNGFQGAGIGLSLVAHIVEAHHGRIGLESAPGTGSTFTMFLPARG